MKTILPLDKSFDLNLLRVLVALDDARSVSKAAMVLDMSQSGFSTALARLRNRFDDALFVRTGDGMVPTPRAQTMIQTARPVLASVTEGVLGQQVFDPMTARTDFHLAMADVAEIIYLPRLVRHLAIHAPQCSISSYSLGAEALQAAMAAGEIDLAIGYFPDLETRGFFKQLLYTHSFTCMVRRGHPLRKVEVTEDLYSEQGHAVVTSPARSNALFERFLDQRKIQRRVVVRTPHHLTLPAIVEETDLLATVPLASGVHFARMGRVELIQLPFQPPSFGVQQHWHRRVHKDPRSRWLRAQIATLFDASSDQWRELQSAVYGGPGKSKK